MDYMSFAKHFWLRMLLAGLLGAAAAWFGNEALQPDTGIYVELRGDSVIVSLPEQADLRRLLDSADKGAALRWGLTLRPEE